jgi:hypothetical protein
MRKLIIALSAGAIGSLCALWLGQNQPGQWLAQIGGRPVVGYDVFVFDHYFIVRPTVLLINLVVFSIVAFAVVLLVRPLLARRGGARA